MSIDAAPPQTPETALRGLLDVMARLRDPQAGCPWDLEQDFRSIAPYTIEEAYEVGEAIERGTPDDLRQELGDLLLQVVYHARMAEERRWFDFADVARAITGKMIARHPHVFGPGAIGDADAQSEAWDRRKAREREEKAAREERPPSILDDVPLALPALRRAEKLQRRAAAVGFDWPERQGVLAKLREEIAELEAAVDDAPDQAAIDEEIGDLFFSLVNLARHLKVAPETALAQANRKFERRFARVEKELRSRGMTPEEAGLETMDSLWDEAKRAGET